jgi:hypothetical protein
VLWIGYLQWHFRTHGSGLPPQPILKDFKNIECRDAVLAWDSVSYATDEQAAAHALGRPHHPAHPVTGEQVPDETPASRWSATPTRARPLAASRLHHRQPALHRCRQHACRARRRLRRSPAQSMAKVPESADFVMYWWHHAAHARRAAARRGASA